jgi:hypothetical protein
MKAETHIAIGQTTEDIRQTMAIERIVGAAVPTELILLLQEALQLEGERALAKRLGISRPTITRAIAGLRVMPGTVALFRERLVGARAS